MKRVLYKKDLAIIFVAFILLGIASIAAMAFGHMDVVGEAEARTISFAEEEFGKSAIDEDMAKRVALEHYGAEEKDVYIESVYVDEEGHHYQVSFFADGYYHGYKVDIIRGFVLAAEDDGTN